MPTNKKESVPKLRVPSVDSGARPSWLSSFGTFLDVVAPQLYNISATLYDRKSTLKRTQTNINIKINREIRNPLIIRSYKIFNIAAVYCSLTAAKSSRASVSPPLG